jgi:transposase
MQPPKMIFTQLMDWIHPQTFRRIVTRHRGDYKVQSFSCWDQFLCLAFAQLTYRESLRDIEVCLRSRSSQLYRLGIRGAVSRSTLAHANEHRPWQMYADLGEHLIGKARRLYAGDTFGVELDQTVYALDATTVDLCLSVFPWARFRSTKAAIKINTLLDLRGAIPTEIYITPGDVHEVNWLDELIFEPGAFYIMDRGYLDFVRLYRLVQAGAFFVTRAKKGVRLARLYSHPVDFATGVRCDQTVRPTGTTTRRDYPAKLRRIKFYDAPNDRTFVFLTNHFELPAATIAALYAKRWQIELFFRWIKQNLRIKTFYGTSDNAVKTQIWIAICVYVLVAILKKELHLDQSLYEILQILSVTPFEQIPLHELLTKAYDPTKNSYDRNQLSLW